MHATEITVPLEKAPDESGTGINWAEAAAAAWVAAARVLGLSVAIQSVGGRETRNRAATVRAEGETYTLEASNGMIAAVPVDRSSPAGR